MATTADVIVVGLGALGSAALHRLADRGVRAAGFDRFDVPNAEGSSHGGSRVLRRACHEHPDYVPLALRAAEPWEQLEQSVRETLLVRTGVLHLGPAEHPTIADIERAARAHALAIERLDADAIRARFPALRPDDGEVGIHEPDAGVLAPERCVAAQVISAVRGGAVVHGREPVTAIEPGADGVAVITERGRYECGAVVVATGAWLAGADSPVRVSVSLAVERRVSCWLQPTEPAAFEVGALPAFVQLGAEHAFCGVPRIDNPGVEIARRGGGAVTTADEIDRAPTRDDEEVVRSFVRARLPSADGPLIAARVCMVTNTPDGHCVVGAHPERERVFVAGGGAGHAFKLAPVLGEIIADMVTGGTTTHAIELFDPARVET